MLVGGALNWPAVVRLLGAGNRARVQLAGEQAKLLRPLHPARMRSSFVELNTTTLAEVARHMLHGAGVGT